MGEKRPLTIITMYIIIIHVLFLDYRNTPTSSLRNVKTNRYYMVVLKQDSR